MPDAVPIQLVRFCFLKLTGGSQSDRESSPIYPEAEISLSLISVKTGRVIWLLLAPFHFDLTKHLCSSGMTYRVRIIDCRPQQRERWQRERERRERDADIANIKRLMREARLKREEDQKN